MTRAAPGLRPPYDGSVVLTEAHWTAEGTGTPTEITIGELLRMAAGRSPNRDALVAGVADPAGRRRWTYAQLLDESERTARALLGRFEPGERVAIWAPNVPQWVMVEFGAALAGIVVVTVNPNLLEKELHYVLEQSQVSGVFHVAEHRGKDMRAMLSRVTSSLPRIREVVDFAGWDAFLDTGDLTSAFPEVRPDDPAMIQYTSGTTGRPKGALLTHRGMCNTPRQVAQRAAQPPGSVWMNPFPMFHTSGCVFSALGSMWADGTHVLIHTFEPGLTLELIETEGGTLISAVPTMLLAMEEHPDFPKRDLTALKAVVAGGTTVPAELVKRVERTFGVWFGVVFGQTELSGVCTMNHPDDRPEDKAETVGRPLDQVEVKIIDPVSGATLRCHEQGEVCVRGFGVMREYFDMPEATAETIDPDGWLHTKDLGTLDSRGYLRITGRLTDMIIRGGENIYPREIEEVLLAHDSVADVAVVGVPDPRWGEQVAAVIRPAADASADEQELERYVGERLAGHKRPRIWLFVDAFPLTASGKVQKFVLREQLSTSAMRSTSTIGDQR